MKTIKESILSNTKTGASEIILKWINDYLKIDETNTDQIDIKNISGKYYTIISFTDPDETNITIDEKAYKNKPPMLNGILVSSRVKDPRKLSFNTNLIFRSFHNTPLDLKWFDIDPFIKEIKNECNFEFDFNAITTKIENLSIPKNKYINDIKCRFNSCDNTIIENINSDFIRFSFSNTHVKNINNCNVEKIIFSSFCLDQPIYTRELDKKSNVLLTLTEENTNAIDIFKSKNKIKKIFIASYDFFLETRKKECEITDQKEKGKYVLKF